MAKIPNPFARVRRWWRSHDTVDGRANESEAVTHARFEAEMNRFKRTPGPGF